jgi:hypothetical protein
MSYKMPFILTRARKRALQAVNDGYVKRVYNDRGNILKSDMHGISSRTLWDLHRCRMIDDEPGQGNTVRVKLSTVGQLALAPKKGE